MLTTILLIIIYLAFISLGLPDSILGVTIPAMQNDLGIPLSAGGLLSACIVTGTIISSFFSEKTISKLGTGKIVLLSCMATGLALLGFSLSPSYIWLILFAIPLGLGGGTVDVALNNYVAIYFKAHHMNWLHSFWGIGATIGPIVMSWNLLNKSWQLGYRSISFMQLSLALVLLVSLPVWKKHKKAFRHIHNNDTNISSSSASGSVFSVPGIKYALITMLIYCSLELGTGLWGSSFLIGHKGFSIETSANLVATYYLGITIGRFLSGFISFKLSNRQLIRYGAITSLVGIIILFLPLPKIVIATAFILIGFGLSPIFPAMIHETPNRFGKELSQKIIGYQMGFAYTGSACIPPLLGVVFQNTSVKLFPATLMLLIISLIVVSELLANISKK